MCVQRVSLELISCLSRRVSVCCTVCSWYDDANYELFLLRTLVRINQYATFGGLSGISTREVFRTVDLLDCGDGGSAYATGQPTVGGEPVGRGEPSAKG